jgi:2-octaprenyl-6-methoxyphenol hydroxylase
MSVLIVGGGMTGATLALAISRLTGGALPVHLIEAQDPHSSRHPGFDDRAIALAAGTCQQLARIGIWQPSPNGRRLSSGYTSATAVMLVL